MDTTSATNPDKRFHSLDALRGFALLLGVVFHSAESFCPNRWSWAVIDVNAHWIFDWFQHVCHSFRMELFFVIAGFFAHLVYHKRGARSFIRNRFTRILFPFLIGWFILYPIFGWIWMTGFAQGGRLSDMGIPVELQGMPPWMLIIGGLMNADFWMENFNLLHLWFLHQLVVIYVLFLAARGLLNKIAGKAFNTSLRYSLDRLMKIVGRSRIVWLVFPLISLPILYIMDGWGVDTPNNSIIPHIPTTLLYGLFFVLGWVGHRQSQILTNMSNDSNAWILIGIGFFLSFSSYFMSDIFNSLHLSGIEGNARKICYQMQYAVMMWSFVIGITALFHKYANKESKTRKYIADSSYWIYLVHHLVVVPAQIMVAEKDWPAALKFMLILVIVMPILFASYHFLVRRTWLGKWLNGKKYDTSKPTLAKPALNVN